MFSSLASLINNLALGPQHRKVKEYLNQATRSSVLGDLGKVLLPQLKTFKDRDLVQATFNKYSIEDSLSHQECNHIPFRNSQLIIVGSKLLTTQYILDYRKLPEPCSGYAFRQRSLRRHHRASLEEFSFLRLSSIPP